MKIKKAHPNRRILFFRVYSAYRKTAAVEEIIRQIEREKEKRAEKRIRCPRCGWTPRKTSLWTCADCGAPEYFYGACGAMWNTFETGGKCPGCAHQWRWTSCLSCHGWSRHEDWYEKS